MNWTDTLLLAFAVTVALPLRLAPLAGERIDTVGAEFWAVIVVLREPPSADAVTVAAPLKLAAVEKANVALAEPAGTVTDAGTVSPALPDCSVTVFATDPGPAIDTVQLPDCPAEIVLGLQASDTGPAVAVRPVETDEVPSVAVSVTPEDPVNDPVFTVKLALVDPEATVTLAGTLTLGLPPESDTAVPPVGAAPDSVTVQDVLALVASTLGMQLSEEIVTVWTTCTIAPVPEAAIFNPLAEAPILFPTVIPADVAFAASVTFTVATTPSAIALALLPTAMQISPLTFVPHVMPLLAAVSEGPGTTDIDATPVEWPRLH